MLTYTTGNLFDSHMQTLVNAVNTAGTMGKGIAREFKERYPAMFAEYVRRCESGELDVGSPYLYRGTEHWVLNFVTKRHYRHPSRIQYIQIGLANLRDNYGHWGIQSLALPALGCGYGGLEWAEVRPLMQQYLGDLTIPIEIYAPLDDAHPPQSGQKGKHGPVQPSLFDDF